MKKFLAAVLVCLVLCGCNRAPAVPEGEETRVPNRVPVETSRLTEPTEPSKPVAPYGVRQSFEPAMTQDTGRLAYETPLLAEKCAGIGYIGVMLTNTSKANSITVSFTTSEDPNFTSTKAVTLEIEPETPESRLYIADLSEAYGWMGQLQSVRILSSVIYGGSVTLEKVEIYDQGSLVPNFTLSDEVVIATRDEMKESSSLGVSLFPDGIMSALKNDDGTYTFISSNPISGTATVTAYKGTLANPVQQLLYEGREVLNSPVGFGINEYNYISVGQVYRFQGSECFTILHLEQHFDNNEGFDTAGNRTHENNAAMRASLALGYSPDNGQTWYYCGEVATHGCETKGQYFGFGSMRPDWIGWSTRDIGNGPFIIKDGYVYLYMIDVDEQYTQNLTVLRGSLQDVIASARAMDPGKKPDLFKKFYNGDFTEPAFAGKSTSVIDEECPPNFSTVIYSTYLQKYVMVRCSSPAYATNDGDIVMNISTDPTDFRGDNFYIDADVMGSQYPTLLAVSGDDPTFTGGRELYVYYISAVRDDRFLWDKADVVRRTITFH